MNHDGDSDSTGAIAGQILGARNGLCSFPEDFWKALELKGTIRQVADDLISGCPLEPEAGSDWTARYDRYVLPALSVYPGDGARSDWNG